MQVSVLMNQDLYSASSDQYPDLKKVIDEMSVLLMLNQIIRAKELCTDTIDKMKRNMEVDKSIADLLNDSTECKYEN